MSLRSPALVVMAAACLLPAAFCAAPRSAPSAHSAAQRTNVLLVTVDTVRADHIGCYGYQQIRTPTVDALAADGLLYQDAIVQVPLTWPSHTAILTGTYPFTNGVQDFTGQPLDPKFQTLAQALKRKGYATGAVVSSFVLDRTFGLARGFDFYDDAFSAQQFAVRDIGLVQRRAAESVDHALAWLGKQSPRTKPFFLWLHLYDPHSPYDPPEPYASEYTAHPYDGEIAYADAELGRLIGWLKQRGLYQRTLIVFLSDHGESLGDHGEREHGFFLYDSTTRVPLIMKLPAGSKVPAGGRIATTVESIDVAPTILKLLGIADPIQKQFQGTPLPLDNNTAGDERAAYSETFYPFSSFGWSPLHSLQNGHYQYIEAPTPELYDLQADAAESHNLASAQSAMSAVMKQRLDALLATQAAAPAATASSASMDPQTAEKLRALGYVAYKSPVSSQVLASGLADPKDRLWEFNSILEAGDDFQAERFSEGAALLKQVEEKDPQMYLAPFMLGEALLRQQQWAEAEAALQQALKLNPSFEEALTAVARAAHGLGDDAGARGWLQQALKQNPQNYRAWYELSWIEAGSDPAEARKDLEKTIALQPNFGLARRDLGLIQYRGKDYGGAAVNLSKAVALGAGDAKLLNLLGVCYRETGRVPQAIQSYKQALALDPSLAEAHLNLSFAYALLGQNSASARERDEACKLNSAFCR